MSRRVRLSSTPAPWHPGYPFRARGGKARRVVSGVALAGMLSLIGGYYFVTDSKRVKSLAEKYLSEVVGGPVRVERARLSIFEGLRLDKVTVDADASGDVDSRLLSADTLYVTFSIVNLLRGSLSDVSITAVGPRVSVVQDLSRVPAGSGGVEGVAGGGGWNFERLLRARSTTRPSDSGPDLSGLSLPRVSLRDAQISYSELKDGKLIPRGVVAVEGTLSPLLKVGKTGAPIVGSVDRYAFAVTERGIDVGKPGGGVAGGGNKFASAVSSSARGSSISGWVQLSPWALSAKMQNLDLGPEMQAMLPGPVRDWWQRHEIAGSFDIPEVSVEPAVEGKERQFRVLARFDKCAAAIHPDEFQTSHGPKISKGLPAIRFSDVSGELLFTEGGIELRRMSLLHEGNVVKISGALAGYNPDAAFAISVACDRFSLPANPSFVPSLPPEPRETWDRFSPSGEGSFGFDLARQGDGKLVINGRMDITNGRVKFENFPYPAQDVTGAIVVKSLAPGNTQLEVINLVGHGKTGTPNEGAVFHVNGRMAPLEGGSEVDFHVEGDHVVSDDLIVSAMPEDVRRGMALFDPVNHKHPEFGGSFTAKVYRSPGRVSHWSWPIDITIASGSGSFEPFQYPLENVAGKIEIRSGRVNLVDVSARRKGLADGDAELHIDGNILYGDKAPEGRLFYDLSLVGKNVPVDATLVKAVPAENREWLEKLGVSGMLQVAGKVTGHEGAYDMGVTLSKGALTPVQQGKEPGGPQFVAADLEGSFRVRPNSFEIERATANRLGAPISAAGVVTWGGGKAGTLKLDVSAKGLTLDEALRRVLPDEAREGWDSVKPEGVADVTLALRPDRPFNLDVVPQGVSITPTIVPVKFTDVRGHVVVSGEKVTIEEMSAKRKEGTLVLSGVGASNAGGSWDVRMSAKNAAMDEELRAALPAMLKDTVGSLGLSGRADLDVRRLTFSPHGPDGKGKANVDFDFTLVPTDLSMQVGVLIHVTDGEAKISGSVRDDRLSELMGGLKLRSGEMASRSFTNVSATLNKSQALAGISLNSLAGKLADGDLSGRAAIAFPEGEPTRYAMELLLRNADVQQLAGNIGKNGKSDEPGVSGRLSASLALEGAVGDASNRRGRGDISVSGDHMAKIPVLLGLVQVANLTLPSNQSFNNASARYVMDGAKVSFDQLAIRSPDFEMVGNGWIDLGKGDVRMTFWTAPPDGPKVPVFSDLTNQVRRELLQIQIRGKIDDPQFGASSFNSFTTTVDEVFRSSGRSSTTKK